MGMGGFNRIVWAVDPFPDSFDLQGRTAAAVKALGEGTSAVVEPVSIVHWDQRMDTVASGKAEEVVRAAGEAVEAMVKRFKVPGAIRPRILAQLDLSLSGAVSRLLTYASETGADLIAVGTHSTAGSSRFLLGSFAETLILASPLPILVVNPTTQALKNVKNIIFATDLSDVSLKALKRVLPVAKTLKSRVTIFHRVEYLTEGPHSLLPESKEFLTRFQQEIESRSVELEGFLKEAREAGVEAEVDVQGKGRWTSDAIVKLAEKATSTIVALVSRTKPFSYPVMGSTTRQVIRHSKAPVWVLHVPFDGEKND